LAIAPLWYPLTDITVAVGDKVTVNWHGMRDLATVIELYADTAGGGAVMVLWESEFSQSIVAPAELQLRLLFAIDIIKGVRIT
jgi:hypothetical protein